MIAHDAILESHRYIRPFGLECTVQHPWSRHPIFAAALQPYRIRKDIRYATKVNPDDFHTIRHLSVTTLRRNLQTALVQPRD